MKILFFVKHYFECGGIQENIYNISNYLIKNHEVAITTSKINKEHIHFSKKIIYLPHNRVDLNKYDVVLIENFDMLPHIMFLIKIMINNLYKGGNYKIILVPHGGYTIEWYTFPFINRIIKKTYHKTLGRFFINKFVNKIVACSNWEKDALIGNGVKDEIIIIRNGIDKKYISKHRGKHYFVFVGRIDPIKNIEEIIYTFKKICSYRFFCDYKLMIVGDYKKNTYYYNKLKSIIIENNLLDKIIFLGKKVGNEKFNIISEAKCLFCLSKIENDPLVVKESLSVSTKVLINTNGGLKDYEYENNVFVKYENDINPTEFYKFLKKKFNNKLKINLLTWEEVAEKYETVF